MVVGIDEVGRGSLAGPLCVAAVAWPDDAPVDGLDDSKALTRPVREELAAVIRRHAAAIGIGWVTAAEIDSTGLTKALHKCAKMAYAQIGIKAPVIVDGREKLLDGIPATYIIKADTKIPAVMAASIVAKVARDSYMRRLAPLFSQYKFESHVGYYTAFHKAALAEFGPCDLHRRSYEPVREVIA